MPSKNASSPLTKHYDKVALVLAAAVLAVSVAVTVSTVGAVGRRRSAFADKLSSLRAAHPDAAGADDDVIAASNLFRRLESPDLVPSSVLSGQAGFFVPETRVWCAKSDCRAPISPEAKVCPVCGTEQPGEAKPDVDADTDGDGMPDAWERKHGLNHGDPADSGDDPDGDGFDNLAEYMAGTDPTDSKDHPDVLSMLRLGEISATPLPIRFQSRGMKLPDNHFRSQFNYVTEETRRSPPSIMVKEGEPLVFTTGAGKIDTGYVFEKLEIRKVERNVTWTTVPQSVEVAYASIRRGKKSLVLEEGKAASGSDFRITIDQTLDGSVLTIDGEDDSVAIDGVMFRVKRVDMEKSEVVIESADRMTSVLVGRDKADVTRSRTRPGKARDGKGADGKPEGQADK